MKTQVAEVAKKIREELKKAFPGVKFSVRSSSYTGGSSISVKWANFPTVKAVEEVARKYKEVSYDEYSGEILSGGNRFVFCSNEWDAETTAQIETRMPQNITKNDYSYYHWFNNAAEEMYEEMAAAKVEEPKQEAAPKQERTLQGEATPRQLWAIHKATGLNTKDLQLSKQAASDLIGRSKNGEDITGEVAKLLGMPEEVAPVEVVPVNVEETKAEIMNEINDITTYTVSQQLQDREHDQSFLFRRSKIDRTAEIQKHFDSYTAAVVEVMESTEDMYIIRRLATSLQRYKKKYFDLYVRQIQHKANNPSWAVTGRGNLNARRYNKMQERYEKMIGESVKATRQMDEEIAKAWRAVKRQRKGVA